MKKTPTPNALRGSAPKSSGRTTASLQLSPVSTCDAGATAVASRVSVRAKSNFHGARVAGVRPVAPRPAAVQTRASARVVEQADDLQLGQVRPSQSPNIRAIDVVDELLPIDPRARPSSDSAPRSGVDSNRRVRDAFAAPRDRARARAVAPRPRRGFRVRANVVHQPTRRNCGYADATSIGSRSIRRVPHTTPLPWRSTPKPGVSNASKNSWRRAMRCLCAPIRAPMDASVRAARWCCAIAMA